MQHYYRCCDVILFCFKNFYFFFQGGQCSRIVNCVLALQSYSEWKMGGKNGLWKYGGNPKPRSFEKPVVRKRSEPFMRSSSRAKSIGDKDSCPGDHSSNIDAVLPDPSEGVIR